jgi:hypothetical protein
VCSIALFSFDEGISHAQQSTIEAQQAKIITLEEQIAPRDLSPEQEKAIADAIRPFAGTKFMLSVDTTVEPMRLLAKVESAVNDGGWEETEPLPGALQFRRMPPEKPVGIHMVAGVWVVMHLTDAPAVKDAAQTLRNALTAAGLIGSFVTFGLVDENSPGGMVHIWVGEKP